MKFRALVLIALVWSGCAEEGVPTPIQISHEEPTAYQTARRPFIAADGEVEIFFTRPGIENGTEEDPEVDDAIAHAIENAATSIDLCLYEFNRPIIVEAVLEAADRGVDVRFVGDGDELEDEGYEKLLEAGVDLALRKPRDRIMHNKFAVIDDHIVITGSMNFSENGVMLNNNHAMRIENADVAAAYDKEFEQMWSERKFGRSKQDLNLELPVGVGSTPAEIYFSPQDDIASKMRELLADADVRVYFMVFSFTHPEISDDLIALHDAGVEVVGVFDVSQARGRYSVDEKLADAGVPVFLDGNENNRGFAGGKLHHKVMLIDPGTDSDPTVVVGSYNFSKSATLYNDENVMVLHGSEFTAPFVEEWCKMMEIATDHPNFVGSRPDPCANLLTPVRINEVMANPDGADADNEWIEIVNTGRGAVSLDGWSLGDSSSTRHVFADTVLPPKGAVVVYSGPSGGRLVASSGYLGLANNADEVVLKDANGVLIDSMKYTSAESGISFNRDPDGGADGDFVPHYILSTFDASPGRRVDDSKWPGSPNIVINEVMADPTGDDTGGEFVELINSSAGTVNLDGWRLGDAVNTERHVFGDLQLGPGESVVVFDSGSHPQVARAVNASSGALGLNNTGDTVQLRDANGRFHDSVTFGAPTEGVSFNRATEGDTDADMVQHFTVPGANRDQSPGVKVDGSLWAPNPTVQLTINELLPNPDGTDTGNEFVELVNTGTSTLNLGGWELHDAIGLRHVFRTQTLAPGAAVVLFDSGDHSDVPNAVTATTGSLSLNNTVDAIRLFDSAGELKDTVVYQSSTSGKSLNRSTDADPNAPFVNHDEVSDATSTTSPGTRVSGDAW